MKEYTLNKDTVVCWEGDSSDCMYYIKWGRVGVYTGYATPKQNKLAELRTEDYFGEMGLIDQAPRSATVAVLEDNTIICRIGEDEFAEFIQDNPNKVDDIITQLSHKLRKATKEYLELCRYVSERVGSDSQSVDEASDYGFGQSEQLRAVHDEQAKKLRDE